MTTDSINELVKRLRAWSRDVIGADATFADAADALEDLAEWKRQALTLEATWDVQAVGRLIKVPLGANILPAIQPALEAMAGEVASLRERTAISLGVGDGQGSLFVYGDHESIKAAQGFIIRENELLAERDRLKAALEAFVKHFGPLQDNAMLHEDVRNCYRLARKALGGDA